jgi:hypothetical protein
MATDDPFKTNARQLAIILSQEDDVQKLWTTEELAAIWKHQLAASIEFDLGGLEPAPAAQLNALLTPQGFSVRSFGELLRHANPAVELLELVKQFGKAHLNHPQSPIPREVSTVLYYAAIVAALLRCGKRITALDNEALRYGVEKAVEQPWLDETTRTTLRGGLGVLSAQCA